MSEEISYLFVPANKEVMFSKALCCGADAIIIDLEDAVHPHEKSLGRDNVLSWMCKLNKNIVKTGIYIRINHPKESEFEDDVSLLNSLNETLIKGVMVPKLECIETITQIKSKLNLGISSLPFLGIIETARGLHHCDIIASSGVARLAFGSLDYSLDINCLQTPEALLYARSRIVIASRLANLPPPIDCVTPDFCTTETLLMDSCHARSLGFSAKLCIHPEQIDVVNKAFSPTEEQIKWAKEVLEQSRDSYAFQIDGSMVDLPLIKKAARLMDSK
ncbi:CoA ester lyase [Salmonella enterica]|uniref:CoA ester lyase n=1 Tax=Salmonella enterica TaxID=28901 RepID=A0A5U2F3H0_SALER|nr:CoA ester lyase [Salmonella enterica]EHE5992250.1 CoA ester lyase [Salmonella enterica]